MPGGRIWGRARPFALALVGAGLLTVAGTASALAHTALLGSDPTDGSVLSEAPSKVALDFTRDVAPQLTRATITDSQGHVTQLPAGAITADRRYSTRLWIQLPSRLARGSYRLSFDTHDSVDLHETAGSIVFGVATPPVQTSQAAAAAPPDPVEAALRWTSFVGLSALLGALALAFWILPGPLRPPELARAQRRLFTIALSGVAIVAAGETALLAVQVGTAGAGGDLAGLVLNSGFGHRWLVGVAFASGLAPLIWLLRRGVARGRPAASPLADVRREGGWGLLSTASRVCLLAAGQSAALAISGHSGGDAAPTISDVALRTLHVVSTGAWAGSLIGLSALLWAGAGSLRALAWPMLRAFSPFAAICFVAAAVTGLLLSGGEVASITALLTTGYGLTLVAKIVLVGVTGLLGLRHAVLLARRRRGGLAAPPRTLRLEALGAVAVIMAAGVLASSQPALGRQFDPPASEAPPSAQTADVGDLVVRLSIEPNRPGQNLVSVSVASRRRPAPAAIEGVKVVLARPGLAARTLIARPGDGFSRYDAGAVDLTAGDMAVDVEVDRSPLPATSQHFGWSVPAPQVPRHPVVVSDARYSPLSQAAAAALTLAGAILAGAILWRRRRSRVGPARRPVGPERGRPDRQAASR